MTVSKAVQLPISSRYNGTSLATAFAAVTGLTGFGGGLFFCPQAEKSRTAQTQVIGIAKYFMSLNIAFGNNVGFAGLSQIFRGSDAGNS